MASDLVGDARQTANAKPPGSTRIKRSLSDSIIAEDGIEQALDDVLAYTLWTRSQARRQGPVQTALRAGLVARTRFLWSQSTRAQRRGYFLAGVCLEAGRQLDEHASTSERHLQDADQGIRDGNEQAVI